jgi:hypothetical protein
LIKIKSQAAILARKVETLSVMENITQAELENNLQNEIEIEFPFFITPNSIIDVEDLFTANEKLVYLTLCRFGNLGRKAFPSLNKLVAKCGLSKPTIIKSINGLIEKGALIKRSTKSAKGIYKHNTYKVIYEFPGSGVVKELYQGSKGALPGVVKEVDSINKSFINKKEIESTQPEKAPARALDSSKEEKPQSEVNQAIGYYLELFEKATGEKAIITKGKDHQLIKTILTTYGIEKTLQLLDAYFETADNFVIERGYSLGIFRSNLTSLLVKYKEQQEIKKKEAAQEEEQRRRQELDRLQEEQFEKERAEWEALPEVEKVRSKLKQKREFIYGPMREHFNKYAEQGDEEALERLQKYAREEGELIKQLRAAGGIEADKLWNELKKEEERIASYYRSNGLRMIES